MSIVLPVGFVPRGRQRDSLTALIPASCALGALVFVALTASGRSAALAGVAGLAACFVPLAIVEPVVFTSGYVAVVATHIDDPMARLGFPSPWYGLNLIAAFHLYRLWSKGQMRINWTVVHLFALAFLATRILGVLVANNSDAAVEQCVQIGKDAVALLVISALLSSVGGARWAIMGAIAGFAALGWLAFAQEYLVPGLGDFRGFNHVSTNVDVGSTTVRHAGPLRDPNFWGRLLVTFFPLSVAALLMARAMWVRLLAALGVGGFLLGIYLTQSRGAFLSVFAGVAVFLVFAGWRYARWTLLAPVVVIVLLANPATGPRMETLFQLGEKTTSSTDLSLVARKTALKAGTEMFADHPIMGIGTGNFVYEVLDYQRKLGMETNGDASATGIAAHNTYVETAAETGVVGLVSLLLLFGASIVLGMRALQRMRGLRSVMDCNTDALWAAALVGGIVAYAVASVFLHLVLFAPFLVLLALVADLDRGYRDVVQLQARTAADLDKPINWGRIGKVAGVVVVITASLMLLVPMRSNTYTAQATFTMQVRPRQFDWIQTYEFDMATRRAIIPSYVGAFLVSREVRDAAFTAAGVRSADRGKYSISTSPTPNSAVLRVKVSGPSAALSQAVAEQFFTHGVDRVAATQMPFILVPVTPQSTEAVQESKWRTGRLALVFGPLIIALIGWVFVNRERNYRIGRRHNVPPGALWCT
ncbi:MAG: O-antigen ligase family protein [Acidimicrobiia bacterium]